MSNIMNDFYKNYSYGCIFIIILFMNCLCMEPYRDDITLFGSNLMWPENMSFIDAAVKRYLEWAPRVIAEWLTYFFAHNFTLFKIANSIICTLFIYLVYRYVNFNRNNVYFNEKLICIFFVCMYPWRDMTTAGHATTFIFYLWPFTALLYVGYILLKYNNKKAISIKEYVLYSISLTFAVNIEQTVIYIVFFSLLVIIYNIKRANRNILNIITLIVSILGLVFLLISPGEKHRFILEISHWYPSYEMLSFVDKINLGLTSTMFHFIRSPEAMILYLFLLIGLFVVVYKKYPNKYYYILMMINFIWVIIGLQLDIANPIVPGMENFKTLDAMTVTKISGYLPTFISMLLLLWPCIGLYLIYVNDNKKCFMIISIYLFSFCDRFIMGFSPTVFASSTRTYLPVFVMLILINSLIYIKIFNDKRI